MIQKIGNDDPKIAATISRAIELDENDQTAYAVELLTRLLEEFPQAASLHGYIAWFSLRIERSAEAIDHGHRAVELAPTSEKASLVYFHALWRSGKRTEAFDEMKRFLAIRPSEEYSTIIKDWKLDAAHLPGGGETRS